MGDIKLEVGHIITTKAGTLPHLRTVHVITPTPLKSSSQQQLTNCYLNALNETLNLHLNSIAITPIGTPSNQLNFIIITNVLITSKSLLTN